MPRNAYGIDPERLDRYITGNWGEDSVAHDTDAANDRAYAEAMETISEADDDTRENEATDDGFTYADAKSMQAQAAKHFVGCTVSAVRLPESWDVVLGALRYEIRVQHHGTDRPDTIIRSFIEWSRITERTEASR